MPQALQLEEKRFSCLVVKSRSHKDNHGGWFWSCVCDCGKIVFVRGSTLVSGKTSACASCAATKSSTTHGGSKDLLYRRWRAMLSRCTYPKHQAWVNCGGRGIKVCSRWLDYSNFKVDMGINFEAHLQLDRINPNGNYCLENCRWASHKEQQNNKRNNHNITIDGETKTVYQWAEISGVKANTLLYRIRRGEPINRSLLRLVNSGVLLNLSNK
jgi:hypothetical protein